MENFAKKIQESPQEVFIEDIFEYVKSKTVNPLEAVLEQSAEYDEEGNVSRWLDFEKAVGLVKEREEKFGSAYGTIDKDYIERAEKAEKWAKENGFDEVEIYEPSYWRIRLKFKRGQRDYFKDLIELYGVLAFYGEMCAADIQPQLDWRSRFDKEFTYHEIRFWVHYGS